MKTNLSIFAVVITCLLLTLMLSCKKDPPKVIPTLTTTSATNITSTTATSGGTVSSDGGAQITACGVCWSLNPSPTISDNKTSDGTGIGSFVSSISGLSPGRIYYLRAYATNSVGTAYGNQVTITTISILSTLVTTEPLGVSSSTATCGGNITSDGGAAVIARGVCWSKVQNPTISDSLTVNGMGIGVFTSSLTRLTPGTPYYIRAYATNSIGTAYGNQVTFNTLATIPTVTTAAITQITPESANGGGTVTYDGGASVTTRGVCWSKAQQPTITDSKTTNGTGNGSFTASITGLTFATTYYIRSYASNSAGTGYGNQISFTTLSKQAEQNIISSIGGTLTTGESVQLIIPANALPADGVVFVGRTGTEPTSVPNPDLKVIGSPITMRLPSDAILKPLQLSFPAPSGPIDTDTYGVFIYNGSTYYPLEYTINGGTVNASIDIINWDITSVSTKSSWNDFYISGVSNSKTPSETGMGLKEATIESGTMKFNVPKADGSSRILLLIHGIWSDPYTWTLFLENLYSANLSYTNYWTFGYNTSYHIKENADRLDALLAQYSNGATIDIVAHSMGGLVARSEIERYKDHMYINRLVTLGTPHQGTDPAIIPYLYDYVIDNLYGGLFNMNDAGLRDLSPSSDFIINEMWALVKPPIPYYTIAARNSVEKAKFWPPTIMLDGDDDGIVSVISAKGVKGATSPSGEVVRIEVKMAHNELVRDSQIFDQVTSYLKGKAPSVTTTPVTTYNSTSATVGGNVTTDGGVSVIETGIYWGTNLLVLGTKRQIGSGTGVFSASLTGLTPNTKYYIVAYAINSQGIGYGDQLNFTTVVIPAAAFTATPTTITAGQSVQFTDQSTNATSWSWTFGDGGTNTTKNPSHTYATAGTYTVALTATNSFGTNTLTKNNYITVNSVSGGIIFNPDLTYGSVTDIDGNIYKTILIGTQTWMAENLKTTKYRNGNLIGTTTPATLDISAESTPKYQWAYAGNESNVATYGRLYTWYAATDSHNVCPTGWHLPTDTEWTTLTTYLGGEGAGGKLKESGTTHWNTPNTGATNSSGFTALPGGYRYYDGTFINIGSYGYWWSPEYGTGSAWARAMYYNYIGASRYYDGESSGFSVRCLRDN